VIYRGKLQFSLAVSLLVLAAGCSGSATGPSGGRSDRATPGSGGTVVVYTSVDEVFAEPILKQFEKETGIQVALVPDTEETKSTGLLNRLIAEKARPRADVFWSGDPVRAAILKAKGVSTAYSSAAAEGLPAEFSDPEHHWTCFSARARVIIYNTDRVAKGDAPTSIHDLANPRFRGDACMANPLFGTTSMHVAALFQATGDGQAKDFLQSLVDNEVKILSSNGEVRRRVANGEFAVGLTDTDDVHVAMTEGKPVDFVYPDADGLGTLVMPNAVVLIADGPNPQGGKRLIDYLLRPETEAALARGEAAQMPLRGDVELPQGFRFESVSGLKTMAVDYGKLADKLDELSHGFLKDWVDRNP
jgi:iron(III) transport system substrate-binding protein